MPRDYGFTRTNYFRITDLDEIDFLMNGVIAEDLEVLLQDSSICIRCAGEIQGMDDELFEETASAMSSKEIEGYYYVATNNKIVHKDLFHSGVETAQSLTKNENFYFRY